MDSRKLRQYQPSQIIILLTLIFQQTFSEDIKGLCSGSEEEYYDFIVIGGGSAGCLIANRLTEVTDWTVLLLEAGGQENIFMDIPLTAQYLQFLDVNWKYKTEPSETACLAFKNGQCKFPRGKVLGGSSVLNYMVYNRGSKQDYDHWAEMGNSGWAYKDVLPYFIKSEDNQIPHLREDVLYHSVGGYLSVSYAPYRTPLANAFLEAGKELGEEIVDYNGKSQLGFSYIQTTTKNGSRWSSYKAFIDSVKYRKNLFIRTNSYVTKILINENKSAEAVEYIDKNTKCIVRAKKEIIVTAGAINSPQLLMLSGIGPKTHLEGLGIPVVQDLKVGYNLMDHISIGGMMFVINESIALRTDRLLMHPNDILDYFVSNAGPLTVPGGCEAIAFFDFGKRNGAPDIELLFTSASVVADPLFKLAIGLTDEIYEKVYKPVESSYAWTVYPILLHPKSKGKITLQSSDPTRKPLIYHNYLTHDDDMDTLIKGIRKTIELSKTKAFQKYGSKLHNISIPGCSELEFGSDGYWKCAIRHFTFTIYHPSGTCKMGPSTDQDAVVDSDLKVHGVHKLRVADASIMPEIVSAHTNAPVYMIAEKASDLIKSYWGVEHVLPGK